MSLSDKIDNSYAVPFIAKESVKEFIEKIKDFDAEKIAERFHYYYEQYAKIKGWRTQESCQVEFKDLPKENKETMIFTCIQVLADIYYKIDKEAGPKLI